MSDIGKHWRVVVQIQEVTPAQPGRPGPHPNSVGISGTERRVHEVAGVNVAAASEVEAFSRAISALQALRPQIDVTGIDSARAESMPVADRSGYFPGER